MSQYKNVRVAVEVLRVYKVNALVRFRVHGGKVDIDRDRIGAGESFTNPRYFNGTVEFLVPRTSIEWVKP